MREGSRRYAPSLLSPAELARSQDARSASPARDVPMKLLRSRALARPLLAATALGALGACGGGGGGGKDAPDAVPQAQSRLRDALRR